MPYENQIARPCCVIVDGKDDEEDLESVGGGEGCEIEWICHC